MYHRIRYYTLSGIAPWCSNNYYAASYRKTGSHLLMDGCRLE